MGRRTWPVRVTVSPEMENLIWIENRIIGQYEQLVAQSACKRFRNFDTGK